MYIGASTLLGTGIPSNPDPQYSKLRDAAKEFEAMLIGSLLRSFQESFSSLSGRAETAGLDEYQYMSTQAVASSLANSGGLGITQSIIEKLTPR